jgi:sulfofructose kinase
VHVVCVGACTLDTIVEVPRHPAADDRVLASALVVAGGGPAATAAVALRRLGVSTFFVGAVGDDVAGAAIRDGLEREGVDVSELAVSPGARSAQSVILVGRGSGRRAIAAFPGTLAPLELGERARDLARGAAWVHVDHVGYRAVRGLRGEVRLSVDAGNPIPDLDLRNVSLFAPTEPALRALYPEAGLEDAARAALAAGAELVVVTRGSDGSAAATAEGEVVFAPVVSVDAVSTLGAGDVFHGALLAQLVREVPLREALAAANACAALACRALDGRSAIPSAEELETAPASTR